MSNTRSNGSGGLTTAFRFLYWEGALAMVYDAWTGPTYLSGLAGQLGAPVFWVTVLCSAAWIGAVGQIAGVWLYERVPSYKQYTLRLAAASRALWALPLLAAGYWYWRAPVFPIERWCALTACVACGAALLGASSASAWSSWMRALVPQRMRGRFFGDRHRYVMLALTAANLVAAFCVDWKPGGLYLGFVLIGTLALVAAALSTWSLARVQDAGQPSGVAPEGVRGFAETVMEPLRDRRFRGIVIYGAAFNGALQTSSSYFPYYFTRELGLSMSQVAFWAMLTNVGCWCAAARWGRYLDREGRHPRRTMRAMGTMVALSPLLYVFGGADWVRMIAPVDYLSNGIFWCGYWLGLTTLLYRSIPAHCGPALCFSIYTAAAGLAGALGSFAGGSLAAALAPWGGFKALWAISAMIRFAVIWGLYGLLVEKSDAERLPVTEVESGDLVTGTA